MILKGYVRVRDPVPVAVQNMVVRDYCKRRDIDFVISDVEFVMPDSYLMLWGMLPLEADGICAYSMFQLPADPEPFIAKLIEQGKQIHFALENKVIATKTDYEELAVLWKLASLT